MTTQLVQRSETEWAAILMKCGVPQPVASKWSAAFTAEVTDEKFSAGESEIDDFLGQILHESTLLQRLEENLNYSAEGLRRVFPSHFTEDEAQDYAHQPERIANRAYASRLGNGDEDSGDGWRYRGRGLLQVTGLKNYRILEQRLGLPFTTDPDSLADPEIALRVAISWWENNVPDICLDNIVKVTKRVNGGDIGIKHRAEVTNLAKTALLQYGTRDVA